MRRHLGARRLHIQAQFLSEALALTVIGGLVPALRASHLDPAQALRYE
jgi:ABC-type antimicrobial peptide transport system permease subunit